MKFLSIRQPWAHFILHEQTYTVTVPVSPDRIYISKNEGKKIIENRTWKTAYRGPLLIHASKKIEKGVEAQVIAPGRFLSCPFPKEPLHSGGIVGVAWLAGCDNANISSAWWEEGLYGWRLWDAEPLPFSPIKGGLGLRDVNEEDLLPETLAAYDFWREKRQKYQVSRD